MPSLKDLRAQIPELSGLDDDAAVAVIHQAYYPDLELSAVASALGHKAKEPKAEPSGKARRLLGDTGLSLLKGVIGVPEAAVGIGDLVTGGGAGRMAEAAGFRPKEARAMLDELMTPEQKAANATVQQADGFTGKLGAALTNPSTIGHTIVESLPSIAAGGVVGRGAMALAPRMGAGMAGAIGEGAMAAGQNAEQVRQEDPNGQLTGQQSAILAASGALTGGLSLLGNKVARSLGIGDVDTLLVAGRKAATPAQQATVAQAQKGFVRKVLEGAASEGILEELPQSVQEQVAQNMAQGKPLDENVDYAAVMGLLSGAVMGGAAAPLAKPGDQLRAEGLQPERGPATRALNAAVETAAKKVDADPGLAFAASKMAAAAGLENATTSLGAAPERQKFGNEIDFTPELDTGKLAIGEPPTPVAPSARSPEQIDAAVGQMHQQAAEDLQATRVWEARKDLPRTPGEVIGQEPDALAMMQSTADAERRADQRPDPNDIREAIDETERRNAATRALYATILPTDILNPKGEPFRNERAANTVAKREGGSVVVVEGGWAVRPKESDAPATGGTAGSASPDAGRGDGTGVLRDGRPADVPVGAAPAAGEGAERPGAAVLRPDGPGQPAAPALTLREQWQAAVARGDMEAARAINEQIVAAKKGNAPVQPAAPEAKPVQAPAPAAPAAPATAAGAAAAPVEADGVKAEAPAASSQDVTKVASDATPKPQNQPDLVKIMTVFGTNTYVRRADIEGEPNGLIRQFTKDGKNNGRLARGNLDPTGEKRAAEAKEDAANPLFNIITRKGGSTFANRTAAKRELMVRGMQDTHEVVSASDVKPGLDGFLIRKKVEDKPTAPAAPSSAAPTTQGDGNGQEVQAQEALTPARPTAKPDDVTVAGNAMTKLNATMRRAGWEIDYVDLDLTGEKPQATIRLNRNDGRWIFARVDGLGRASFESFQRDKSLGMVKNNPQARVAPLVDDVFLGRQKFDGARSMLRGMVNYLVDNSTGTTSIEDMRAAWAGVMAAPTRFDALEASKSEPAQDQNAPTEKADERTDVRGESPQALDQVAAEEGSQPEGERGTGAGPASSGEARAGEGAGPDAAGLPPVRSGRGGDGRVRAPATGKRRRDGAVGAEGTGRPGEAVPGDDGQQRGLSFDAEPPSPPNIPAQNFRITPELRLGRGGEVEKFGDNIAAIRTLKAIEAENRRATAAEQQLLARYVGWGGLASAFPDPLTGQFKDKWKARGEELRELLTPSEYAAARRSTRNAHYTSETVVSAMWDMAKRLGFRGGLALESSMGPGNFLGLAPQGLPTRFIGIEYDSLTARIATALYPQAAVLHSGFQKVPLADNAFALNIGNPPFGSESLRFQYKPELAGVSIHNQFFRAGIDAVRPGGLQIMVVSRFLMDAQDKSSRLALARKARLVAAIRLPDTAFKENARTEVVTDIIILQKLTEAEQVAAGEAIDAMLGAKEKDPKAERERLLLADNVPDWVHTGEMRDPLGGEPMVVNRYFRANPQQVLGVLERSGSMQHGADITVRLDDPKSLDRLLAEAVERLPEGISKIDDEVIATTEARFEMLAEALRIAVANEEPGHLKINADGKLQRVIERESPDGGEFMARQTITPDSPWSEQLFMDAQGRWYRMDVQTDAEGKPVKVMKGDKPTNRNVYTRTVFATEAEVPAGLRLGQAGYDRLLGIVGLRDLLKRQLVLETEDAAPAQMEGNRQKLAKAYEEFIAANGPVNRPANLRLAMTMPDGGLVAALEDTYQPERTAEQAKKSGLPKQEEKAAPAAILRERVVPKYEPPTSAASAADALAITLAERGRVDIERIAQLRGVSQEQAAAELQEGDKPLVFLDPETQAWETADAYLSGLVKRKLNAAQAAGLTVNVTALEKVQPETWTAENVAVQMGATWVPTGFYAEFVEHLLGGKATVSFAPLTNSFTVSTQEAEAAKVEQWSSDRAPASYIITRILNSQPVKVTWEDNDGKVHVDEEKTALAILKSKEIVTEFGDWIFKDADRRARLVEVFNEKFNTRVVRQYDGQHLTLPGKVPDAIIAMRRHQKNAIWRGISSRYLLLDHVVGAGKTFTGIARAMERRRMGLARKPVIVVPNHLVEQWASDVYRLYPGAKVLAAGQKDFEAKRRRRLFSKIATGDWDIVIVPHSSFGFIGISPDTEMRFLEAEMRDAQTAIEQAWEQAKEDGQDSGRRKPFGVKEAERLAEKIQQRMDKLSEGARDRLLTFEQLGIDDLTVDEAHEFKNLFYSSRLTGVRGMGNRTGSRKAADLYNKVRVLREGGGAVTFMTGTPVSNSAVELYTMMRYLAADELAEQGLTHFDAWRAQYVDATPAFEPTETGRLKEVTRMGRSWSNMRSLMDLYYQFTDAVTIDDIKKWYAEDNAGKDFPVPKVKGGERRLVKMNPTSAQERLLQEVIDGFDGLPDIKDPFERNKERLRLMDRARKVSLDVRAVDPRANTDERGGKLEVLSKEIKRIYDKWTPDLGTQLVFLDRSVPRAKGDDKIIKEYDELVARREKALREGDEEGFQAASDALEKFDSNEIAELRNAQAGGWNAYQQIKDNLVAMGVPANEIRFIQEASNDEQKQAIFDAVKGGKVRVLIGSTQRMGAGTNVQDRIVGLHHADVTWKPSDIEQREGRAIRQGNLLLSKYGDEFAVEILAYATERTVDAKMWDLNATKLRTINGLRKYDGAFTMDIEDEESVSMAEMAALASGNPLLLERVTLESQITNLELLERAHKRKMYGVEDALDRARRAIKENPAKIASTRERAGLLAERVQRLKEDHAARKVTVEGEDFTASLPANQAALAAIERQQAGNEKARYAVTINGQRYTSKEAITDAIGESLGDFDPFEVKLGGKTFTQRTAAGREAAAMLNKVTPKVKADGAQVVELGSMFGYRLVADLDTYRWNKKHVGIDLTLLDGEKTVATYWAGDFDPGISISTAHMRDRLGKLAEQVQDAASPRAADYLEQDLERATRDLPELEQRAREPFAKASELAQKRARLVDVVGLLSGARAAPVVEDASTNLAQTGAPEANTTDVVFSRAAPAVATGTTPEGFPEYVGQRVTLAFPQETERFEVLPEPGQKVVSYAIMPAEGFDVLGHVELLMEGGRPVSLLDIEVYRDKGRGAGVGRATIETLLAANPDADLNISNIVPEARGFWERMGVPQQNVEGAYDGTLNWRTYAENNPAARSDAQASRGARGQGDAGRQGPSAGAAGQGQEVGLRRGAAGGLPLAAARQMAAEFKAQGAVSLEVVQSVADLPASYRNAVLAQAPDGRVRGAYFRRGDRVFLIADHIRGADEFVEVALHEAFHRGLGRLIPGAKPVLNEIWRTNQSVRKATAEQMRTHGIGREKAIEEALAKMAEAGTVRDLKGWPKLLEAIRSWLGKIARAVGIEMTWTDDMVADLVAAATREGLRGGVHVSEAEADDLVAAKRAPSVTVDTDEATGAPVYATDDITIGFPQETERFEYVLNPGEKLVNYSIGPADGFDSYGFVELVIGADGVPKALADIEIKPELRGQAIGEKVMEALLGAHPGVDIEISNIVEGARGFWSKMGVPEQNRAAGEAYDGTLNYETFRQAQDDRGANRAAAGRGEAGQGRDATAEGGARGAGKEAQGLMLSRADPADMRAAPVLQQIQQRANDLLTTQRTFNWWHRTVGTQFHKAKVDSDFGRVFNAAQDYLHDTSAFANDPADLAPDLLPQLKHLGDLKKSLTLKKDDREKLAAAVFEGTLNFTRDDSGTAVEAGPDDTPGVVWTPTELRERFGFNDQQVKLYEQTRAAIDRSLDTLVASDVARLFGEAMPAPVRALVSSGDLGRFRGIVTALTTQKLEAAQAELAEVRKRQRTEMAAFWKKQKAALEGPQGRAGTRHATIMALEQEKAELQSRHASDKADAEAEAAKWAELQKTVSGKYQRIGELKARGYAPLQRFGRYTLDVVGEDGTRKFFGLYESEAEANAAARAFREAAEPGDKVSQGVLSEEAYKQFSGMTPETLELFAEVAGVEKNEVFQEYLRRAKNNRSALKRLIHRKGVAGYSEDTSRVLAQFIVSNARAASTNLHVGEIGKAIQDIPKEKGDVIDEAIRLREYVQTPQEEAQAIRALLFAQYLGGSVASAMVNLTQPLMMTLPYLSQFGGVAVAVRHLTGAVKAALGSYDRGSDLGKALALAEKEGIVSPQELHQLQAEASGALARNPGLRRALFAWGSLFSAAEQFNRRLSFIAAFNAAKDRGMEDPAGFAARTVEETQGIYNRGNKPRWARGAVGGTLFTFKQYSVSYMEFLKRLPTRERTLALAVLLLAAGAQGMPGADDLDDIIDTLGQGLGYDTNAKLWKTRVLSDAIGDDGADFVLRGFSALPGFPLDVAGRLGLGNLIPGTGLLLKSKTDKAGEVAEALGPVASTATGAARAIQAAAGGNVGGVLEGIAPKGIKDLAKALEMYQTGEYRDGKGRKVTEADAADALVKGLGFQPATVARDSRRVQMAQQQIALARVTETEIADTIARARVDGKPEDEQAARQRLARWNEVNPESRIVVTPMQIIQRVRQLRTTRDERFVRAAPREMRQAVTGIVQ